MTAGYRSYVHTEGDSGDVLFELPNPGRKLGEGDTFTATLAGGSPVTYRVETVDYRIEQFASANPSNPRDLWKPQEVYYGVSIVP